MTKILILRSIFISLTFACLTVSSVLAQTTAFTYQGKLTVSGTEASVPHDFTFRLFTAASGGSQVGLDVIVNDVPVTAGVFTVNLDFGAPAFTSGTGNFLEISVRLGTDTGAYTPLSPLQPITSVPYSIKSINADNATNAAQLGGAAASQYVLTGDPRLSDARNPIAGSSNYIQNQNAVPQAANFRVNGTGTANIIEAATQYNINGGRVLGLAGFENLFVGPGTGQSNSTGNRLSFVGASAGNKNISGADNSFFGAQAGRENTSGTFNTFVGSRAGIQNTSGCCNSFFGDQAGTANTTGHGNTALGEASNFGAGNLTSATVIGAGAVVSTSNTVVLGRSFDAVQAPGTFYAGGNAGIGTSPAAPVSPAFGTTLTVAGTVRAGAGNVDGCDLLLADDICFFDEQNASLAVKTFDGTAYAPIRAGAYTNASSIALKKNVSPLKRSDYNSMLDKIVGLPLFTYRYKNESATAPLHTGLIAEQSPASLLSGDGKAVNLYDFISLNAGATKALAARVSALTTENTELKRRLDRLERRQSAGSRPHGDKQQDRIADQQRQIDELRQIVCTLKPDAAVCTETNK